MCAPAGRGLPAGWHGAPDPLIRCRARCVSTRGLRGARQGLSGTLLQTLHGAAQVSALLGDMKRTSGVVLRTGSLAYVAQVPALGCTVELGHLHAWGDWSACTWVD